MKSLNFSTPLEDITFSVVDTETTGMNVARGDEIIEIAAIYIRPKLNLDQVHTFSSLIKNTTAIHPMAEAVHCITEEMLHSAPPVGDVIPRFAKFVNGTIIVAHNARFDLRFIQSAYKKCNIINNLSHVCDSLSVARKLLPHLKSHSLDSLITYFDVKVYGGGGHRHRALYDAERTAIIFILMLGQLNDIGCYTLGDLYNFIY